MAAQNNHAPPVKQSPQDKAAVVRNNVFMVAGTFTLYYKVRDCAGWISFNTISAGFVLPDDLFQQVKVLGEGFATGGGE